MFCKTVWNGLHILPDGYIRLCSIGANSKPELEKQSCRDRNGNQMHILTHSIKDIMNSDKHREVRRLNVKDENAWSPHCRCCELREIATNSVRNHPNRSRRIYLMTQVQSDEIVNEFNFREKVSEDGSIDYMPSSLDIRFGNLCNQRCIMCGPAFSNLWYDEYFDYYKRDTFGQSKKLLAVKNATSGRWESPGELNWYDDPRWWPKFEEMAPHLTHIYITGGEPMVTPAHDVMLDKLIESGYAKNILLEYDTNCSAINNKIIERWDHFRGVDVRGSMDSIGSQYEIIRFPGKWDKFTDNVKRLRDHSAKSNGKIRLLSLTSCFQMTTMFSVVDSEQWCLDNGFQYHIRFLEGPLFHSVASLPDSSKLKLIDYYDKQIGKNSKAEMIIKYLQSQMGATKITAVEEFVTFMDYLDKSRGTDWRPIFPETRNLVSEALSREV